MGRIEWREIALDDLEEIYWHIAAHAPTRAKSYLEKLRARAVILAEQPLMGPARLPAHPNVRLHPYDDYVFLYCPLVNERGVDILRVIHAAQDYRRIAETLDGE